MSRLALPLGLLLGSLLLGLAGCGRDGPGSAAEEAAVSPVGRWRLDRDALLAGLAKQYAEEGPTVVAREQARARDTNLELELAANGAYRVATLCAGIEGREGGTWKQDGKQLFFSPRQVDGKAVESAPIQIVRYEHGRIEIDLDGKVFPLARR